MVTSIQSPHLPLPLTSFGPQKHKIPAEIQPRIRCDECNLPCHLRQLETKENIYGSSQHLTIKHLKLTAPTLNSCMTRMAKSKTLVTKRETTGEKEGTMGESAKRTLFDPMHDDQPACLNLTERKRTAIDFQGREARSEFRTRDMPQDDDTWKPNRHHSNITPLLRNHLIRAALPCLLYTPRMQKEKGRRVVLGLPELSNVYTHPPRRLLLCHRAWRCCC